MLRALPQQASLSQGSDLPDNDGNVSAQQRSVISRIFYLTKLDLITTRFINILPIRLSSEVVLLIQVGINFVIFKDSQVDPTQITFPVTVETVFRNRKRFEKYSLGKVNENTIFQQISTILKIQISK